MRFIKITNRKVIVYVIERKGHKKCLLGIILKRSADSLIGADFDIKTAFLLILLSFTW